MLLTFVFFKMKIEDTWERPSAAEISLLFSGGMSVNVRTALYRRGELRGHVKQLPYGGHHASFEGQLTDQSDRQTDILIHHHDDQS